MEYDKFKDEVSETSIPSKLRASQGSLTSLAVADLLQKAEPFGIKVNI